MSKKYLDYDSMPPKLPIMPMIWTATALKVFNSPEWLYGVWGIVYLLMTISAIYKLVSYKKTEL